MYFSFLFHFLALATSFLSADLNTCPPSTVVDPPANLNDSWYWPDGWNTQQNTVPQFDKGQNCVWKFNVPKGMYAYFGAAFTSSDSTSFLKLTDSQGGATMFSSSDLSHPYFLVDPSFSVQLHSTTTGYLGIRVAWFQIPQTPSTVLNVIPDDAPLALIGDTFNNATTIQAHSRVSLVSIKPIQAEDDDVPSMRLTLIYDGPSVNSKFLGNLWQVMLSGKQIVSSGSSLTLYSVWPGTNLGNIAVVQDYQNVQQFSSYGSISCYLSTKCQVQIDARNGTAALVRYSQAPHYLVGIQVPKTAQLQVYSGAVNANTKAASYSSDQSSTNVPQEFESLLTTYTLDQSIGSFTFSGRGDESKWSEMFDKRQGVLSSANIGISSADQTFSYSFSGTGNYRISLNASITGVTDSATLTIGVYQNKKLVSSTTYTAQSPPQTMNTYEGNQLAVIYDTNGSKTKGCHLEFLFESKGASAAGTLLMMMIMSINYFR